MCIYDIHMIHMHNSNIAYCQAMSDGIPVPELDEWNNRNKNKNITNFGSKIWQSCDIALANEHVG